MSSFLHSSSLFIAFRPGLGFMLVSLRQLRFRQHHLGCRRRPASGIWLTTGRVDHAAPEISQRGGATSTLPLIGGKCCLVTPSTCQKYLKFIHIQYENTSCVLQKIRIVIQSNCISDCIRCIRCSVQSYRRRRIRRKMRGPRSGLKIRTR